MPRLFTKWCPSFRSARESTRHALVNVIKLIAAGITLLASRRWRGRPAEIFVFVSTYSHNTHACIYNIDSISWILSGRQIFSILLNLFQEIWLMNTSNMLSRIVYKGIKKSEQNGRQNASLTCQITFISSIHQTKTIQSVSTMHPA